MFKVCPEMYPFLHSGITILIEVKNTNMKIMASWRKVHWSDESRFLLHVTDGDNRTLFMLSVPLLKLFLSEDAVMVWGDVFDIIASGKLCVLFY
jgi:hypothetical protein